MSSRFRAPRVERFSPSNDDEIGYLRGGRVFASRYLQNWFDMVAVRLENLITAPGDIKFTNIETEPEGWLRLNGQSVDARRYPNLAAIYGVVNGVVTLPDYTDRMPMGAGNVVPNLGLAGSRTVTLEVANLPKHKPQVIDPGHSHAAIDRGHEHGFQAQSHDHSGIVGLNHNHEITQVQHTHEGGANFTADNQLAAGTDHPRAVPANTGPKDANISINDATLDDTSVQTGEAETDGIVLKGFADIDVKKAKTGISIAEIGEDKPVDTTPPVFGVYYLVKT